MAAAPGFGRVSVSGHSSGAHLTACLLDGAWWRDTGLSAVDFGPVRAASGPYELEPVRAGCILGGMALLLWPAIMNPG